MANDESRQLITDALDAWTRGDQNGAVERVRAAADNGDPVGLALISWFLYQMGEPRWREGIPYAEQAIRKGMPWVAAYYFGSMIGDPTLRQQAPGFLRPALEAGWWQIDALANAMGPFQQGDRGTAVNLVELGARPPLLPANWEEFANLARQAFDELTEAAGSVSDRRSAALTAIDGDVVAVAELRSRVETRTNQLETLIDQVSNAEAQSLYDTEATKYESEGRGLWRWGVGVLACAAAIALLPILVYYIGKVAGTGWFEDQNIVAAHFAPAVALGAVAGVLLARARGRDRARQRARDLSVALGTMFVYSGQITDEGERQRFLHDMTRAVLEASLRQDGGGSDSGSAGLLAALTRQG
jgi:hypothetical protein